MLSYRFDGTCPRCGGAQVLVDYVKGPEHRRGKLCVECDKDNILLPREVAERLLEEIRYIQRSSRSGRVVLPTVDGGKE